LNAGLIDFISENSEEVGLGTLEHECGFSKKRASPYEYIIKVENGVITSVGYYWERNLGKLENIIRNSRFNIILVRY